MKKKIAVSPCFVDTIQLKREGNKYRFVVPASPWAISQGEEVTVISPEVEIESDSVPTQTYKAVKIQHTDKKGDVREGWVPTDFLKD